MSASPIYLPPFVGPAGLTVSQYLAILNLFVTNFSGIYGVGAYAGIAAPDYQMMSVLALAAADQSNAAVLAFNSRSPNLAVGSALDGDVAYNGLIREAASYSTCPAILTGTAGTIITNAAVRDSVPGQGYLWNLPTSVQIGTGGTVTVTATCNQIGSVPCGIGQLNQIATPTSGWTSVNNSAAASPGQPIETDTQLRTRQSVSTELPSQTQLAGTQADVLAVVGAGNLVLCMENPTGTALTAWPIAYGNPFYFGPAHYITVIAEGGSAQDIGNAIYGNKGPGPGFNGTTYTGTGSFSAYSAVATSVSVTDPDTGQLFTVYYYVPVEIPIYVTVVVNPLTSAYGPNVNAAINAAIVAYLNGLGLGQTVSYTALIAAAMSVDLTLEQPVYDLVSLKFGLAASPTGTTDIQMQFPMFTAQGLTANVSVTP